MNNHIVLKLSPDKSYSRHSEGALLRLKDNSIALVYCRFKGSWHDDSHCDLVLLKSFDEGETWSKPTVIMPASFYNTQNVMSVTLMRMDNGDVGMFYLVKQRVGWSRLILSRSNDELNSFYSHKDIINDDRRGYYVMNNDRAERLKSGRILLPVHYHRTSHTMEDGSYTDPRSCVLFMYSDDDGVTWHESTDTIYAPFTNTTSGLQEAGAIQKQNGTVWGYCRTDKGYQYEMFSLDEGNTWTPAAPSRFTSPLSPMKIARHPSNALYAIWNPIPNHNIREKYTAGWGRTPLVMAKSTDDGISWSEPNVIESEEDHGYCYPFTLFLNNNEMLLGYCSGGPNELSCLSQLTINKICL